MREPYELIEYANKQLMDETNDFFITLKVWLHDIEKLKSRYPKPTIKELDEFMFKLLEALKKDQRPMKRY